VQLYARNRKARLDRLAISKHPTRANFSLCWTIKIGPFRKNLRSAHRRQFRPAAIVKALASTAYRPPQCLPHHPQEPDTKVSYWLGYVLEEICRA